MANEVNIDASELDDVLDNLERLKQDVPARSYKFGATAAQDLFNKIIKNIEWIFDGRHTDRKPEQDQLLESFDLRRGTTRNIIQSTAPHALPLEDGASPHEITPNDADLLAIPASDLSVGTYGGAIAHLDDVSGGESGNYLLTESVDHPGNKAYNYILSAQMAWNEGYLKPKLPREMRRAITRAGFKPSLK
jgi:hypothetical protein